MNIFQTPLVLIGIGLYAASFYSFLLFHTLAELASITVAFTIFLLVWNCRRFLTNGYLVLIGFAYAFVGIVDLTHTLAYKGMNIFIGFDANLPTQLWIGARYMQSLSLLAASFFISRMPSYRVLFMVFLLVTIAMLASIFSGIFPDCFIEGVGLTTFKVASEYIISLILISAMWLLIRKGHHFAGKVVKLLLVSIACTIVSELAFTFYVSVYGLSNLVGHFFKLFAFYLIYRAIIVTGLMQPYDLLFRELNHNVLQLEAANKELEAFSYSVSHDLRAPLRGIEGFSKILTKNYGDRLGPKGQDYLDRIVAATNRMNRLIDDLLSFSMMGRQEMKHADIDMAHLAQSVYQDLEEPTSDQTTRVTICPMPQAEGDHAMIRQVLSNLIGNAIKYSRPAAVPEIEVGGEEGEAENVYYVRDNGVGFDMRYSDKLFIIFQRLHSMNEFEGTGVGLAIVQRIVHRHGGKVWADGAVGKGATFYFSLPKMKAA